MRCAGRIGAALGLLLVLAGAALAGVAAVDAIGLTVSDAARAKDFYTRVLGFAVESDVIVSGTAYEQLRGVTPLEMRVVRLRLGEERIELTQYLSPPGRRAPADGRSHDRWFQHLAIVVSDMDAAYARLRRHAVRKISPAPQRIPDWNHAAAGIRALYFKDPDGHPLELIWFPPGKGDPRWQQPGAPLFRGIDHTAIAVADTDKSLAFYRDRLGFRVAGASENYGPEQERLNGVAGSRVRITGLRASRGPGIEFLEYLTPRDGRPYPPEARPNDLVSWNTRLVLDEQTPLESIAGIPPADPPDEPLGFDRGVLLRDPDGHLLEIVER